ncbi:MAG TPA: STAS domain-containing protein [Acidimicrobiales bacterium]|nr:STAS domain-containing protein [Acidimicrobiales bacterium]
MSASSEPPGAPAVAHPPSLSAVAPLDEPAEVTTAPEPPSHFSIVIGRRLGTVVVTVHGELDMARAGHLGNILADLIDGQGNLSVVVDLHEATTTEPDSLLVFIDAAERARRRGGTVLLNEPHPTLGDALQLRGLDHFVGPQPRR